MGNQQARVDEMIRVLDFCIDNNYVFGDNGGGIPDDYTIDSSRNNEYKNYDCVATLDHFDCGSTNRQITIIFISDVYSGEVNTSWHSNYVDDDFEESLFVMITNRLRRRCFNSLTCKTLDENMDEVV